MAKRNMRVYDFMGAVIVGTGVVVVAIAATAIAVAVSN